MSYETKNIRNICLLGHGNSGKTSLAESMLFTTALSTVRVRSATATPSATTTQKRSSAR